MENDLILNLDTDDAAVDKSISKLQTYERMIGKISSKSEQIARTSTRVARGGGGGGGALGGLGSFAGMQMLSGGNKQRISNVAEKATTQNTSRAVEGSIKKSLLAQQAGGFGSVQAGNVGRRLGAGGITAGAVARTAQRGAFNRVGGTIGSVLGTKVPILGTIIGAFIGSYLGNILDRGLDGVRNFFGDEGTQRRHEDYENKMNEFLERQTISLDRFIAGTSQEQRRVTAELFGEDSHFRWFSERGFDPGWSGERQRQRQELLVRQAQQEVGRRREGFGEEARTSQRDTYVDNAVRRLLRP